MSQQIAVATARPAAFLISCAAVLLWGVAGPAFSYSDTWQLALNTVTSIVTFLMVFVLQNSQMRDTRAMQAKLDDLLLRIAEADTQLVGAEEMEEEQFEYYRRRHRDAAKRDAAKD